MLASLSFRSFNDMVWSLLLWGGFVLLYWPPGSHLLRSARQWCFEAWPSTLPKIEMSTIPQQNP